MRRIVILFCTGMIAFGAGTFLLINSVQGGDHLNGEGLTTETISVTTPPSSPVPVTEDTGVAVAQLPPSEQPSSYCLDCHSDAELLQEVAEEEVVQESLSEGSG